MKKCFVSGHILILFIISEMRSREHTSQRIYMLEKSNNVKSSQYL